MALLQWKTRTASSGHKAAIGWLGKSEVAAVRFDDPGRGMYQGVLVLGDIRESGHSSKDAAKAWAEAAVQEFLDSAGLTVKETP
jgi:hypothetical protein